MIIGCIQMNGSSMEIRSQRLMVRWDDDLKTPTQVVWEDGREGTVEDVETYRHCTHSNFFCGDFAQTIYDIDAVALTRFDESLSRWVCTYGRDLNVLEIDDPLASDEEIRAESENFDPVYRTHILRIPGDAAEELILATGVNILDHEGEHSGLTVSIMGVPTVH